MDAQEQVYVENYLLGRPTTQSPPFQSQPPNINIGHHHYQGEAYPTNDQGQPVASYQDEVHAGDDRDWDEKASLRSEERPYSHTSGSPLLQDDKNHFGPAPLGPQQRRNKTKKRVALTHGNLVLDCPIPTRLASFLPRKDAEEFRFMRYSAVTCDVSELGEAVDDLGSLLICSLTILRSTSSR